MAADLHIHIRTSDITEEVMDNFFSHTMGHKRFNMEHNGRDWMEACDIVRNTPQIHVGEVSWLKAALFGDADNYIPGPVMKVAEAINDECVIDDELITKVKAAFEVPNTTNYDVSSGEEIIAFLEEHKGKQCFTVSW